MGSSNRFKIVPACYLYLVKDGKILMIRRYNTGYEDSKYSFVAGHLDGDETFTQAMAREAKEEAGITLDMATLRVVHVMHRSQKTSDNERIDVFLRADKWEGEPVNNELDKCDDMNWFEADKLSENVIPYIKQAIDCIQRGVVYSEFGF